MSEATWRDLCQALSEPRESAGILAARLVEDDDGITLLARQLAWAPGESYLEREHDGLQLSSTGWVPAARAALHDESVAVFVHTHPDGLPVFSRRDGLVDADLSHAISAMGAGGRYAALVIAGSTEHPTLAARIYEPGGGSLSHDVGTFRIVGDRIRLQGLGPTRDVDAAVFDRQIRAFGAQGQSTLKMLRVGVVGVGGTGSAVAEQLARLGVGQLTIIDDDVITDATPTRGYGTSIADVGLAKAEVVARHIDRIGLATRVIAIVAGVQDERARRALNHLDVIFSCVDGHGARLVLNRWAYAHLAPVIDVGILLSSIDGVLTGMDGRVTWLSPGAACLLCRDRIDPALAYAEILDPVERQRLAGEGYAVAAATAQPAVITLTSLVSSLATTELLTRLFDLADQEPTELLVRVHDRDMRRNRLPPRDGCFCTSMTFLGRGVAQPHLDLMWPS